MKIEKNIVNDLYLFYNWCVASHYTNNVYAKHIDKLATELTKMRLGEYKKLCVSMPPRFSKSSMITLAYPLWLIFQNPRLNIFIINGESSLSERFGIQLREYIREFGPYFNVYLSDVKHSSTYIMFENKNGKLYQGSIRLVGAGGSITGQNADYLIIDDPYRGFEDITPSLLQKKIDWFKTMIIQRLEPETRLIILHTRWNSHDLQGYLKTYFRDDYKFLSFPAILPNGESLWGERYSINILQKKREEMGERLFEAIYQQHPLDDTTDFFVFDNIQFKHVSEEEIFKYVRAWDIAEGTATANDYTVGAKVGILNDKKTIVIKDIVRGKFGSKNKNKIKETARLDGVGTSIVIEPGSGAAANLLYDEWEKQLQGYIVKQVKPIKSKVDRATPLQNAFLDGKIIIDLPNDEIRGKFISEFKSFPDGLHDDIVDAIAHAYNYFRSKYKETEPTLELLQL